MVGNAGECGKCKEPTGSHGIVAGCDHRFCRRCIEENFSKFMEVQNEDANPALEMESALSASQCPESRSYLIECISFHISFCVDWAWNFFFPKYQLCNRFFNVTNYFTFSLHARCTEEFWRFDLIDLLGFKRMRLYENWLVSAFRQLYTPVLYSDQPQKMVCCDKKLTSAKLSFNMKCSPVQEGSNNSDMVFQWSFFV